MTARKPWRTLALAPARANWLTYVEVCLAPALQGRVLPDGFIFFVGTVEHNSLFLSATQADPYATVRQSSSKSFLALAMKGSMGVMLTIDGELSCSSLQRSGGWSQILS
jgi:hypothetical protein